MGFGVYMKTSRGLTSIHAGFSILDGYSYPTQGFVNLGGVDVEQTVRDEPAGEFSCPPWGYRDRAFIPNTP